MKVDTAWFQARILKLHGSQHAFASRVTGSAGKPLDQAAISLTIHGKRQLQLHEVPQFARLLKVSPLEILLRIGVITKRDIKKYFASSR